MDGSNTNSPVNKQELTLNDLALLIQRTATKEDIDSIITARLTKYQQKNDRKFEELQSKVETATVIGTDNSTKIDELQNTVEILKQDQLKSNICISGVPAEQFADGNTSDVIIKIANWVLKSHQTNSHHIQLRAKNS